MMILGAVLLVLGLIFGIYVLWILGLVLLVVGALWWFLSIGPHPTVRRHYTYW